MSKNNLLEIKNLHVEFPLFGGVFQREISSVKAIKDFSIDIPRGKTVSIVGESGSGKSTLGKAILNVLKLTAPDVRINGQINLNDNGNYIDLLSLSSTRSINFLFA